MTKLHQGDLSVLGGHWGEMVFKPHLWLMHINVQQRTKPRWEMEWLHISDWVRDTGGFLTCRFSNSKHGGGVGGFSSKHVKVLLHSQWSFSVHRAELIRFPTHTVFNDISLERVFYIEPVKWVIIIENIACGCSCQWYPPSMHSCMCSWMYPQRHMQHAQK